MKSHRVEAGECISGIAYEAGLHPDTVWNDPANEELRKTRENRNVLVPGDVVAVPDKRLREEKGATGKVHRFRRLGVPEKLNIVLRDVDKPRKSLAYTLEIDGNKLQGTTGADGKVEQFIPPDAKAGRLIISETEVYELALGFLEPTERTAKPDAPRKALEEGIEQRLRNLGYLDDEPEDEDELWADEELEDGELPRRLREALEAFQFDHELEVTGELDDPTKAAFDDVSLS